MPVGPEDVNSRFFGNVGCNILYGVLTLETLTL
jgi:hypothetical protein